MKNLNTIFDEIRSKGGRITKIRRIIAEALMEAKCLMSEDDIIFELNINDMKPNRSTIFRELNYLVENGIILKNRISGNDYYEIPKSHHHHLVCTKCKSIKPVRIGNHLSTIEEEISKKNEFRITNHVLEFYGVCGKCKKIKN